MAKGSQRKYKFAAISALYVSLMLSLFVGIFLFNFSEAGIVWIFPFAIGSFLFSFLIIQHRIEKFILKSVKKIYKDVRLLDETNLSMAPITTDMAVLTREVERFAQNKKLEIQTLNIRENYRKEFMGNISHELKTPLFTVQGYILTLLDGAINDKKVRKQYLQRASKGVDRLIYIIQELDMITRLETGGVVLQKENFDIIESIRNVFELFEMKSTQKNITLALDKVYKEPIMVFADKERIEQVLTNLIVNSLKYAKQDGTTEIGIESLLKNKVLIRVTDNGEGIAKENLPRIFERFYRVDKSGSRKEGGSGLGLSIVKHIVEAHDEKIYIESQLGVGSEFSFTLEKGK